MIWRNLSKQAERLFLFFLAAIFGCACDDLSPLPLPEVDASNRTGNSDKDPGAAFEGTWGGFFAFAVRTHNVYLVNSAWSTTWGWSVFNIVSDGDGQLTITGKGCRTMIRTAVPNSSVRTTPIEKRETEPEMTFNVMLRSDEFVSDRIYLWYGVNMCDASNPQLPETSPGIYIDTSCEGPCTDAYCDQEGDGFTGMTYKIKGDIPGFGEFRCATYISGYDWLRLSGKLIDRDTITGTATELGTKWKIHGADHPFCRGDSIEAESDGCDKHQYFRLVRIADDAACDDVLNMTDCTDNNADNCDTDDQKLLDPDPTTEDCENE